MGDPTPGKAGAAYNILKVGGEEGSPFGVSPIKNGGAAPMGGTYMIGKEFVNPEGMPSGPGFPAGDPAAGTSGGKRRHRKTRTYPRGYLA